MSNNFYEVGEYTKYRTRLGRYKKKDLRRAHKLIKAAIQSAFFRWQSTGQYGSGRGSITLFNYWDSTNSIAYFPMRTFELTQCANEGSFTVTPMLEWRGAAGTVASGGFTSNTVSGISESNVSSPNWITEGIEGMAAGRRAILKYSDIKMMLYGTQNAAVEYDISIVSFPDYIYNPFTVSGTPNTEQKQMMQYLIQQFAYNPLIRGDPLVAKKIHYCYHKRFIIQGTETTEKDSSPHYKKVEIFKKWDTMYKMDWDRQITNATETFNALQTTPVANVQLDKSLQVPHPNARKYLIIRCLTPYRTAGGVPTFSTNTDSSFDIFVRQKWEYLAV